MSLVSNTVKLPDHPLQLQLIVDFASTILTNHIEIPTYVQFVVVGAEHPLPRYTLSRFISPTFLSTTALTPQLQVTTSLKWRLNHLDLI